MLRILTRAWESGLCLLAYLIVLLAGTCLLSGLETLLHTEGN